MKIENVQEKVIQTKKNGIVVLILTIMALIAEAFLFVLSLTFDHEIIAVICGIVFCLSCILLAGLKAVKPQEALVLTLFGEYYGTLKGPGFYFVNPFCVSFNSRTRSASTLLYISSAFLQYRSCIRWPNSVSSCFDEFTYMM